MKKAWIKFLNWLVPPVGGIPPYQKADISHLDRMDGVGHKHHWVADGIIFKCECGRRVPQP